MLKQRNDMSVDARFVICLISLDAYLFLTNHVERPTLSLTLTENLTLIYLNECTLFRHVSLLELLSSSCPIVEMRLFKI